jgi:hypothetical protein
MNRLDSYTNPLKWLMALLIVAVVAGCGGGGGGSGVINNPAPTAPGAGTGAGAGGHGPAPVNLRSVIGTGTVTSPKFVILAKTAISTTGTTAVTGDLGLSPAAATYITGFGLSVDTTGCFSTSSLVTGKVFASDYTGGGCTTTSPLLTTAVLDMQTAYTDAAGRAPDFTEVGAGNIGGMTLPAGTYKWGTGVLIPTDVTLSGGANERYHPGFRCKGDLDRWRSVQERFLAGCRCGEYWLDRTYGRRGIGSNADQSDHRRNS